MATDQVDAWIVTDREMQREIRREKEAGEEVERERNDRTLLDR